MELNITGDTLTAVLTGQVVGGNGCGIFHKWDGSVLTVTSDSGTSSADLRGPAGADGKDAVDDCRLPAVDSDENGKVLMVSEGVWKAEELPREESNPPKAVRVSVVRDDDTVTVSVAYDDGGSKVSVIALDENDYPLSVTTDGVVCQISWEGFGDEV